MSTGVQNKAKNQCKSVFISGEIKKYPVSEEITMDMSKQKNSNQILRLAGILFGETCPPKTERVQCPNFAISRFFYTQEII
jgi:hypothetical protein